MDRKLIKSLLKVTAYPEPTESVRLIETHVSFIFLTDHFVYKVKKPVDYGFLNFTTIDRRRFYCEEEVRLNRRLCPDIYVGVVELRETAQGASFGSGGSLVDYAVKMKRLPEGRMLSHLVERGEVAVGQMSEIARFIAGFHQKAAKGPEIDACGSIAAIRANWNENFTQVAPFRGETIAPADLTLVRGWVERFLAEREPLFRARVEDGFIRDCDGDLHLENICLSDRICIFDCIEFNEKFRYIDTASDIAFLLMDLEYAGRPDLCAAFLTTYEDATGDRGLAPLLDFYRCHRAFVRGKVKSLRMREPGIAQDQREEAKAAAVRYFRLARGYTLRERLSPSLILTCGLMGSGKSALARQLAFELGLPLARSDEVRKELAKASAAPVAAQGGEPAGTAAAYDAGIYSSSWNQAVYRELLARAAASLSSGRGIVVDATFRRRSDRERFRALAAGLKVPFYLFETRCPEPVIRERLEKRRHDPAEISDGRWEIFPQQRAEFEETLPGEATVIASDQPLLREVDQALNAMGILP